MTDDVFRQIEALHVQTLKGARRKLANAVLLEGKGSNPAVKSQELGQLREVEVLTVDRQGPVVRLADAGVGRAVDEPFLQQDCRCWAVGEYQEEVESEASETIKSYALH